MKKNTLPALKSSIAFFAFLICFNFCQGQLDTAQLSAKLLGNKDKLVKESVLLVYKDGKIIYKKELGTMNMKTKQSIGAASQWLTTALVMTFVQEGKLSLNDKVSDYLPVFSKYGKGYISIAHCLTHNTGIQNEQGVAKIFQKSKFHTLEEEVNDYAAKREIGTNPGIEFNYSNMGFNIVARVLEVISKRAFDRLMTERLFRPLMMRNSTFANEDYNDAVNPAFGARSAAADYINFLSMILNKGNFNGKPFLNEESMKFMLAINTSSTAIKNAPKMAEGLSYAPGSWILQTSAKDQPTVFASPSLGGMWPIIDLCHQYALIHFTKFYNSEQRNNFVMDIKSAIDETIGGHCN
ncbi:MAG: beta-lactamase family protein [Chitinophagaceae bacterium]|nr:beta-lactamase family protein [Chitinophagaceae bacterium]